MLNTYFGFSCFPFENSLDQRFMFLSEGHKEVTAALLYFVKEKKGFAFLCGEVGTGKTMIVHHLLGKLPQSVLPILIPNTYVEFIDILRYVARALKIDPQGEGVLELADELKAALTKASHEGRQVLLIIDEAHNLPISTLENIRLISNIEIAERKLLQILMIGQGELGLKLQRSEMRQLLQRINVSRILSPMSPSETIEYIDQRLKIAKSSFDRCFEQGCKKQIHEMTGGVPRSINRLCETALHICMTVKGDKVTRKILKKAHKALDSEAIRSPEARPSGVFSSKKLKAAFATTALILLLTMAIFYLAFEKQEPAIENQQTVAETPQLPILEAKSQDNPRPGSDENSPPNSLPSLKDSMALGSASHPETHPGEAQTFGKMAESLKANDEVPPPVVESGPSPAAPKETEAEDRIPDKNPGTTQHSGQGADQVSGGESVTEVAVPQIPRVEQRASGPSNFFILTIRKGETICRIAAQFFPENPDAGIESILAANPQLRNKNRIMTGQTLRIPQDNPPKNR